MSKKPILVVPLLRVEQDLYGLLAEASAGARVFIEQDDRLVAELRALDVTAATAPGPESTAPLQVAEQGLGLRDRARELFLDSIPARSPAKAVRRRYFGILKRAA